MKNKRGSSPLDLTIPFEEIESFGQKNQGIVIKLKSKSSLVLYKFMDVEEVKEKLSEVLNEKLEGKVESKVAVVKKRKP